MSLRYQSRRRKARQNRAPLTSTQFKRQMSNPDWKHQHALKAGMILTAGLLTVIHGANTLLNEIMLPTITNETTAPTPVQAWADAHPDVNIIVAETIEVGTGPWQTPVGGYVSMTDNTPTIYISTAIDGYANWDYVMHHEYAHILQENHTANITGVTPSTTNPLHTAIYFTHLLTTDQQMSTAFPITNGQIVSAIGINSLERAADCYAQQQAGITDTYSYIGDNICTPEQVQASSLSLPNGSIPTQPNPVADIQQQEQNTHAAAKIADIQEKRDKLPLEKDGNQRPLGASGNSPTSNITVNTGNNHP